MKCPHDSEKKRHSPLLTHVLLCFFISSVDVSAASSPLDQIPSPSASFLLFLGLVGVLGALLGAWVNPTQVEIPKNKPAEPTQQPDEVKIDPQKQEYKKKDDSSTSSAPQHHNETA